MVKIDIKVPFDMMILFIIEKIKEGKQIFDTISTTPNPVLLCFNQSKNEIRLDEILMIQ